MPALITLAVRQRRQPAAAANLHHYLAARNYQPDFFRATWAGSR